ncbi:MAG: hypothetical protein NTX26_01050, partial [Candidatus Parcubacteria bacterium]|nr:hypothetical protein [Candidatus Parcubacteria bacterium]
MILAIFFLGLPFLTRADIASYTLEQGIPFIGGKGQTLSYDNFSALFQKFITAVYIIAAIAAFIKIFLAGLKWYTSGGSSKAISQSREDIKNALIGLAFLFLAGTLLVFINPNLNKISSIFIGDIKATPANESGSLKSIGGYYAQAILSTKLDVLAKTAFTNIANPPGFRFTITTGCRVNNDSSCNPNYCKPSPYTCSICSMGSDSCGEPLTITPCHFNGNCVDLVPSGSYTDAI